MSSVSTSHWFKIICQPVSSRRYSPPTMLRGHNVTIKVLVGCLISICLITICLLLRLTTAGNRITKAPRLHIDLKRGVRLLQILIEQTVVLLLLLLLKQIHLMDLHVQVQVRGRSLSHTLNQKICPLAPIPRILGSMEARPTI